MPGKKMLEKIKHLNLLSLSIPLGVLIVSASISVKPVVQQCLVGIVLIWFGFEMITGCQFWQ